MEETLLEPLLESIQRPKVCRRKNYPYRLPDEDRQLCKDVFRSIDSEAERKEIFAKAVRVARQKRMYVSSVVRGILQHVADALHTAIEFVLRRLQKLRSLAELLKQVPTAA